MHFWDMAVNRRQFLGAMALGFGLSACNGWDGYRSSRSDLAPAIAPTDDRPIVVIGAGMSGLAAAKALSNAGHQVRVMEARDRIGGRTWTTHVGEAWLDLGGAWIHGDRRNPMAEYVRQSGLDYYPFDIDLEFFVEDGKWINDAEIAAAWALAEKFLYNTQALGDRFGDISVKTALDKFFQEQSEDAATAYRARFLAEIVAGDFAGDLANVSLFDLSHSNESSFAGGDFIIDGGYQALLAKIAAGLDITLNAPVQGIRYTTDGIQVSTANETIDGSHAIITVPLGVLKSGAITFEPPLPATKQAAIDNLGFGSFEKVVLVYEAQFWLDQFTNSVATFAGLEGDRAFPYFMDFTEPAGQPTLVCLYAGAFAETMLQGDRTEADIIADCIALLEKTLGRALPQPIATYASTWTRDPYSLGSYSYWAIGSGLAEVAALAEPVQERLLFAGEATDPDHHSTVHGAFISGLREAQHINPQASL